MKGKQEMTTWTESMDGTKSVVMFQADGFEGVGLDQVPEDEEADHCGYLVFQHGPVKEVGSNGTTIELVISALIARLEGFQRGPFASDYNSRAIGHLSAARQALEERTANRQARGVEGVNKP